MLWSCCIASWACTVPWAILATLFHFSWNVEEPQFSPMSLLLGDVTYCQTLWKARRFSASHSISPKLSSEMLERERERTYETCLYIMNRFYIPFLSLPANKKSTQGALNCVRSCWNLLFLYRERERDEEVPLCQNLTETTTLTFHFPAKINVYISESTNAI